MSTKQLLGDEPVARDFGTRYSIRGNFIRGGYDFFTRRLALPLFLVAVAASIGTVVSKAEWLFLGAIVFLWIGLLAPVPAALGGFALLIPFDSLLALGSTDDQSRSLTWFVGAGAAGLLFFAGVIGRRLKAPPISARWWIAFTCWAAASCLWALNPSTASRQLPTLCAFLVLYMAAACIQISEKEIQWTVTLATIGALVASAITVYQYYQGRFFLNVTMRGSLIVGDRETNPNAFALGLLFPLSMTIVAFTSAKRRTEQLGILIAMSLMVLAIFLTMSRGGLLSVAIVLTILFFRYGRGWRRIAPVLVIFAFPALLMPSTFFQRLQESSQTGGAGRLDIWTAGLQVLKHYFVIGAGLANFPAAYTGFAGYASRFEGYQRDAHNIFLAVTSELGIIGLLLFLAAIASEFRAAARTRLTSGGFSPILAGSEAACWGMLAASLFANTLFYKTFWFSWIMLMLITRMNSSLARKPLPYKTRERA